MGLNLNPAPERREYSKIALGPETGRRIGYAEQALAEMEGEIASTSDALDMLIRQLTPLINERPEKESAQAGASDRSGHSAHVEQIMGYTRRIAQMKERIQRTAALLEI